MTQPPGPTQRDRDIRDTQNPWERHGWIMAAIWLVFLMFPLTSAFTVQTSWVWRAFAIVAILAFSGRHGHRPTTSVRWPSPSPSS